MTKSATRIVSPLFLLLFLVLSPSLAAAVAQARPAAQAAGGPADLFHLLDFRVQERGDLRFAGRHRGVLTLREAADDSTATGTAVLDVENDPNGDDPNPMDVVRRGVLESEGVSGVTIRSGRPVTIDRVEGYEVVATAKDSATGEPLLLFHAALPTMRSLVHFKGRVGGGRGERFLPQFRAVAGTFHRTEVVRAELAGVRFEVAGGYQEVPGQPGARVAVFRDEETESGLFLTVLKRGADREAALDDVLPMLAEAAAADTPHAFRWMSAPPREGSGHGSSRIGRQGFNGHYILLVTAHTFDRGEQTVLAGYFFVGERGARAAALSGRYIGGSVTSYPATEAFAWLVRSIFGEERARDFGPPVFTGVGISRQP